MPNIASSIQEYCKKINSRLHITHIISLFITAASLFALLLYIQNLTYSNQGKVTYVEQMGDMQKENGDSKNLPFGSVSGKTYTFSWCSGSSRIQEKNKIIFPDTEAAERSGRTLSRLCQR